MNILTFIKKSIAGELTPEQQVIFLKEHKDVTAKDLASVVRFLHKQILQKPKLNGAIDICGTGGSGLERINTSTIATFILADLGVKVAKHGNKAASGRFGSFDLLESLGIKFSDNIEEIEKEYKSENKTFMFAPFFHPVMKNFMETRRLIGKPTFFNILGPLLNPASPKRQIIGTAFKDKMEVIAQTCKLLGKEKVYVLCGEDGLDEVTLTGKTFVTELSNGKIKSYTISPKDFGIKSSTFKEISGGNTKFNTEMARRILEGKCNTRHRDLVLINCALALELVGKVKTLREGFCMASNKINMPSILKEIVKNKMKEVEKRKMKIGKLKLSERDFAGALKGDSLALIAEVKRTSPSQKVENKNIFSPVKIAQKYERYGASAISVLCDKKFFGGDLKYMKKVAENTLKTPILCKDFIIDEYQIFEARKYGADAILLIAAILSEEEIVRFIKTAKSLNMDALCEIHTIQELNKVLECGAEIIGINNRDLHSFKIDLETTKSIAKLIPKGKIIVSESGISSKEDVEKLRNKVDAILVGTALMKGSDISDFVRRKIKMCGIRNVKDAEFCEKIGVNFVGINFVPTSKRVVNFANAKAICKVLNKTKKVGVFQNQTIEFVNDTAKKLNLDYIQLSGDESVSYVKNCKKPVIKTISIKNKTDIKKAEKYVSNTAYILFDGASPGSGKQININLKNIRYPFLIAGGISLENLENIIKNTNPLGVDLASGIETNGQVDQKKINQLFNKLKSC